jgi:hypothetical protein
MLARLALAWRYVLIALLLAGGPAAAQPFQPQGVYTHAPSGLAFPESLGGMRRAMAIDYERERPGLGVGVKYVVEGGIFADVYVFTAGQSRIATGITDPLVQRMVDAAVRDIYTVAASGRYTDVKPAGNQVVSLGQGAGAPQALVASFTYVLSGNEVYSQVYGLAAHNHFVKVRVTYPQEQALQSMATLAGFLDGLGAVVGSNVQ